MVEHICYNSCSHWDYTVKKGKMMHGGIQIVSVLFITSKYY